MAGPSNGIFGVERKAFLVCGLGTVILTEVVKSVSFTHPCLGKVLVLLNRPVKRLDRVRVHTEFCKSDPFMREDFSRVFYLQRLIVRLNGVPELFERCECLSPLVI